MNIPWLPILLLPLPLILLTPTNTNPITIPPNPIVENLHPDLPSLGNGPITVIEFYNYECTYCKEYFYQNQANIQNAIEKNKITYYPVALFPDYTPESQEKILGNYCAAKTLTTEQFFDYQNYIYASARPQVNNPDLINCIKTQDHLVELGHKLFQDLAITAAIGVQALPTLVTSTHIYVGTHENYWNQILFPLTQASTQP